MESGKTPKLKLVSKHEYEELKDKYGFFNQEIRTRITPIITAAAPSDILAFTVVEGSGLKILNVEIFNEEKEDVFIKLLKDGVGEVFIQLMKDKGLYEECSMVCYPKLNTKILKDEVEKDIRKAVDIVKDYRISLSKRKDVEED